MLRCGLLTETLVGSPGNSLTSLLSSASLGRAVADAVGPVGLGAEAANVTGTAAELGVGNASHVVSAQLLPIRLALLVGKRGVWGSSIQRTSQGSGQRRRWRRQQ